MIKIDNGGSFPINYISTATTNKTEVQKGPGFIMSLQTGNLNASPRYLKIYDKDSIPDFNVDLPVMTILIPGNASGAGNNIFCGLGIQFKNGLAFALTTGIAPTDNGAVAASEITVNIQYR